nr:guanine nucleotide exchange factor for Rab-3A isoform X2 [Paramormyrops kingsleyae]
MDAFEGIHSVQLSPSLKPAVSSGPGYKVLVTGNSGIAVYSSPTFFGQLNTSGPQAEESRPSTQEEGCAVGRLIDLEPESEPGTGPSRTGTGQAVSMPLAERGADGGKREQYNLSRLRSSSLEIKEKGSEFLKEQLDTAQRELQLKDKECERLSRVRDQLEQELEELTASLFEEAHKMVREANVKQAAAEKQLKEAQGKIDVLQAEVTALKTLVLTSTPSSPNRQMHPQLMSPGLGSKRGTPRRGGGHFRNKSASGSLALDVPSPDRTTTPTNPVFQEGREIDSSLYAEFLTWREAPSLNCTSAFLSRVYKEDIRPCLSFTCSEPIGKRDESPSNKAEIWLCVAEEASSPVALSGGPGGRGEQFSDHRAGGRSCPSCGEGVGFGAQRTQWLACGSGDEMCPYWYFSSLPASNQTRGQRNVLLHFALQPRADHGCVQFLHLHPLHSAGPGQTGC